MSEMHDALIMPVKVHVVSDDTKTEPRGLTSTFTTRTLAGTGTTNQSERLLGASPNRRRAVLTIIGQSSDIVYICNSRGDAQQLNGAAVMGLQVIELWGTDDVHVGAAANVNVMIGIVAEYCK